MKNYFFILILIVVAIGETNAQWHFLKFDSTKTVPMEMVTVFYLESLDKSPLIKGSTDEASCQEKMKYWLDKEIKLLDEIRIKTNVDKLLSGSRSKVIIKLLVDKTGAFSEREIISSSSEELNKITHLLMDRMPDWTPGILKGKPVNTYMHLTFYYELKEGNITASVEKNEKVVETKRNNSNENVLEEGMRKVRIQELETVRVSEKAKAYVSKIENIIADIDLGTREGREKELLMKNRILEARFRALQMKHKTIVGKIEIWEYKKELLEKEAMPSKIEIDKTKQGITEGEEKLDTIVSQMKALNLEAKKTPTPFEVGAMGVYDKNGYLMRVDTRPKIISHNKKEYKAYWQELIKDLKVRNPTGKKSKYKSHAFFRFVFSINEKGEIDETFVSNWEYNDDTDQIFLDRAREKLAKNPLIYEPATRDGKPIKVYICLLHVFERPFNLAFHELTFRWRDW